MRLFQYWDDEFLPDDIQDWPTSFRELNKEMDYILFSKSSASEFIISHYGEKSHHAFLSLRVPAMQADYLRLCLLDTYGGLYCDIDHKLRISLSTLLEENPGDLMLDWGGQLNTAFLLFRNPGNPYIRACLDICVDNITNRRFRTAISATGPGIQNAVRAVIDPIFLSAIEQDMDAPYGREFYDLVGLAKDRIGTPSQALCDAFSMITVRHTFYISRWMDSDAPKYKSTDRHWLQWTDPIYAG